MSKEYSDFKYIFIGIYWNEKSDIWWRSNFSLFAIFLNWVEEGSSNNSTENWGAKKKTCLVGDLF